MVMIDRITPQAALENLRVSLARLRNDNRSDDIDPSTFLAVTRSRGGLLSERDILDLIEVCPTSSPQVRSVVESQDPDAGKLDERRFVYTTHHESLLPVAVETLVGYGWEWADFLPAVVRLLGELRHKLGEQIVTGRGYEHQELRGARCLEGVQRCDVGAVSADALTRMLVAINTAGGRATFVAMNFEDALKLAGPFDGKPELWGVPVIPIRGIPTGTVVTGDYRRHAALRLKSVCVTRGSINELDQLRIRAEAEAAMEYYRPAAFVVAAGSCPQSLNFDHLPFIKMAEDEMEEFDRAIREGRRP